MNSTEMQEYKLAIGELQRDIARDSSEIRDYLRKLGEYLSYQEADTLADSAMEELHHRIGELRAKLPDSRQQVKKILQTAAGNEQLEREIRDRKAQIADLAKNNREICEVIGRAAYRAYKNRPVSGQAYEQLFQSLEEQEKGLADLEAEQETLREQGRGGKFFKIFREGGRSVYLKGLRSLRRKAVGKTYHEVGEQICSSPRLQEELEDPGLREALDPYRTNENKINNLQKEVDKLYAEQEKKWSELKNLGAHRSHQKRVREIESEIQRIEAKMQDEFEALGTLFRNSHSGEPQDTEAAGLMRRMRELGQGIQKKEKRIERFKAAQQIDGLENQLGNLAGRVSRLEGEIESRRREVESLRAQIADRQKQIQRLTKIRGSKHSLLEEEST